MSPSLVLTKQILHLLPIPPLAWRFKWLGDDQIHRLPGGGRHLIGLRVELDFGHFHVHPNPPRIEIIAQTKRQDANKPIPERGDVSGDIHASNAIVVDCAGGFHCREYAENAHT